jgi:hypothetical protein
MLNKENIQRELSVFARSVVKSSRQNLTKMGKNSSKKLYDSLGSELNVSKNSFSLSFLMEKHGEFQDKGVNGKIVKHGAPFSYKDKQPPAKAFDKWIVRKGIAPRDAKGKFISRKSLTFLIARSVYLKGIKPSLFFTRPFEGAFKKLPDDVTKAFGLDMEEFLKFTLKK